MTSWMAALTWNLLKMFLQEVLLSLQEHACLLVGTSGRIISDSAHSIIEGKYVGFHLPESSSS